MSLNIKNKLVVVAKEVCRDLRRNQTNAEKILWETLRNKKFCNKKFYRQHPFFHDLDGKETFFIADFYCSAEKLIVALDGNYHKYRLNKDRERTKILNHLGLRVIRFRNEEVIVNLDKVLEKIKLNLYNNEGISFNVGNQSEEHFSL